MRIERIHGACILARYSTDNQNEDSIEIQVQKCTDYCSRNNIPVLDVYPDYAVSGMKTSRAQLDRMLEDLRQGRGDTVVILEQSRMTRNLEVWLRLRSELNSMGVRLISVMEDYVGGNMQDPNVFMQETTKEIFHQMYVLYIRQKVFTKLHHMAANGDHTGGKPALGYRVEDKHLVIDEKEADIVRRIFREYDDGRSYAEIIAGLNRDGIKTKRGSEFGKNSLNGILHNEKYIGTLVYGERVYRPDGTRNTHKPEGTDVIRLEDAIPAIISREQFARVQERMAQNKHQQAGRPSTNREYPLKGKVFCGECGSGMHVRISRRKGHAYYYYNCNSKQNKLTGCANPPIRADELEDIVETYVRALLGNPRIIEATAKRIQDAAESLNKSAAAQLAALIQEDKALSAKIDRLVDAIADGAYSATLSSRLTALEAQKAKVSIRIAELKKTADVAALPSARLQELFAHIVRSAVTDRKAIFSIVTKVEVFADDIKIYTTFDPDNKGTTFPVTDGKSIEIDGIPSGVPRIFIDCTGLVLLVKRHR